MEGSAIYAKSNCLLRLVWNIMAIMLSNESEVGRYLQKDRFHRAFHGLVRITNKGDENQWRLILYAEWKLMRRLRNGNLSMMARLTTSVPPVARYLLTKTQKST